VFEYKVVRLPARDEDAEAKLNELGSQGWENIAIAVDPASGFRTAYIKKAIGKEE